MVLVSKRSATGGRCDLDPASTIQVDANHSEMVKLSPGHHLITVIAYKLLREMPGHRQVEAAEGLWNQGVELGQRASSLPTVQSATEIMSGFLDPWLDPDFWDSFGKSEFCSCSSHFELN